MIITHRSTPHLWPILSRSMAAHGYCRACSITHSLPTTNEAREIALSLMHSLQHSSDADSVIRRKSTIDTVVQKGKMIGVLLCKDDTNSIITLKAFAGASFGRWYVPGWCPVVGGENTSPTDLSEYVQIQEKTNKLAIQQKFVKEKIQSSTPSADLFTELAEITSERKLLAVEALSVMRKHQYVVNFRGQRSLLQDIFVCGSGRRKIPSGVGDCATTKLLAEAGRRNLRPYSIAEIFVGDAATKNNGLFYDACKERCEPVLGFMLCGL